MRPRLVEFFVTHIGTGFFVPDYAFAFSVAILLGLFITLKQAERTGLELKRVFQACVITIAAAFVSARLFVILQQPEIFTEQPFQMSLIWSGGMASFGAYFGGGLTALLAARSFRLPVARFFDCCTPAIPLAIAIGRVGCFMNGCCHGKVSGVPWSMRFPEDSGPYDSHLSQGLIEPHHLSLAVHPTQLYESIYALALFFILLQYRKQERRGGYLFALLALLYPLGRFLIEFLRDDDRGFIFGLSTPQVFSLGAAAIAVSFLVSQRLRFSLPGAQTTANL